MVKTEPVTSAEASSEAGSEASFWQPSTYDVKDDLKSKRTSTYKVRLESALQTQAQMSQEQRIKQEMIQQYGKSCHDALSKHLGNPKSKPKRGW
jgi:hypothetical protein